MVASVTLQGVTVCHLRVPREIGAHSVSSTAMMHAWHDTDCYHLPRCHTLWLATVHLPSSGRHTSCQHPVGNSGNTVVPRVCRLAQIHAGSGHSFVPHRQCVTWCVCHVVAQEAIAMRQRHVSDMAARGAGLRRRRCQNAMLEKAEGERRMLHNSRSRRDAKSFSWVKALNHHTAENASNDKVAEFRFHKAVNESGEIEVRVRDDPRHGGRRHKPLPSKATTEFAAARSK